MLAQNVFLVHYIDIMKRFIDPKLTAWKSKKDRKPLILKGARQVGKTFSLLNFGAESFQKVHYLNFEKDPDLSTLFEGSLDPKRLVQDIGFKLDVSINIEIGCTVSL